MKLPKALIKKYGISKKAWSVFRSRKSGSRTKTKRTRSLNMKKRHSTKKSGFGFGKILQVLGGAAIAAAYEVFVSPMIPLSQNIKNIIELVLGLVLMFMPKMPMLVRATGAALATVNAYALIYPLVAGTKGSGSSWDLSSV